MFLLKIRSERQENAFQTSVIDTLDGIGKFLADALAQTEPQLPSMAEQVKKKNITSAELNVLGNAFEKALHDSQSTLVGAVLISKHVLQDPQNIFQILEEVLLNNKKYSFEILDFMSKQKIFYPILHKILETLKQERDGISLNQFIEVLCESESIFYVHHFTSGLFSKNKIDKLNPTALHYAIKNNYELGQIKDKETILFFDGSSIILSGRDFSDAAGEYVFIKRDKQNLIEFKDHDLKEYKWKIRKDYVISEDEFIFLKSPQGKIISTFLRGFQKVYSNAEEFLAGSGEAVLSLKEKGLYIPFLEEGKLFYIIYDKEKLIAVQNGKAIPIFNVKDYAINEWRERPFSLMKSFLEKKHISDTMENPSFLEKATGLDKTMGSMDYTFYSLIKYSPFWAGIGLLTGFGSSFFIDFIYALITGFVTAASIFFAGVIYAMIKMDHPYSESKKFEKRFEAIKKEAMDFYLEYHAKN